MKKPRRHLAKPVQRVSLWESLRHVLGRSVNGASLAAFRIAVGLVMALEAYSLCRPNLAAISTGKTPLETYYTGSDITFHFPFPAFSWLPLLPAMWIYVVVGLMAVAGVMVALGLFYRVAAVILFLTWGFLWVVESTRTYWQSHYYLEFLLTFLLAWLPAARAYSVDAWRRRGRGSENPVTVPFWPIFLLRGQLVIAYFYAGVAKLNADWLLDAMPVRWFLAEPGVTGPYERFLSQHQVESFKAFIQSNGFAYFISYTGLIFDLAVGFLLLCRRTRIFGLVLMLIFHATNYLLIFDDIGWFPLVGALTALIFLDPDWPLRLWRWIRHPLLKARDWNWFWSEGWKLKATPSAVAENGKRAAATKLVALVLTWLGLQALIPLRHYAIAGDGRFTYEGMSFSWRLKTEARLGVVHTIYVDDSAILVKDATGRTQINWEEWHGERVIYRELTPGRIDWRKLPEIVVLLEPIIGERILFNPYPTGVRSETEAQERLKRIWLELYGNAPEAVQPALAVPWVFDLVSQALGKAGNIQESEKAAQLATRAKVLEGGSIPPQEAATIRREVGMMLNRLRDRNEGTSELRRTQPFALQGESQVAPFLIIEDARLFDCAGAPSKQVNTKAWRNRPEGHEAGRPVDPTPRGEPLVVYMGLIGSAARELLPLAYLVESPKEPRPRIRWNSARDLSVSKVMHTSVQAFYLRRYARRIASLWQKEYHRRPAVRATTAMSLNGRPYQELVDPEADLGRVPVRWFRHNEWIRDLQTRRIPPEALAPRRSP